MKTLPLFPRVLSVAFVAVLAVTALTTFAKEDTRSDSTSPVPVPVPVR